MTDDPVKIAQLRQAIAFNALLAIRPWQKDERSLARQVLNLAAREVTAALAEARGQPAAPEVTEPPSPKRSHLRVVVSSALVE